MKILGVKQLAIPEIKVIRFARFCDQRGFFTEHFRKSDFQNPAHTPFLKGIEFLQTNESHSRPGTIRGLHFQWNPFMGKLVRVLFGHMVDLVLDIRKGSPTFGKLIAYDMPSRWGNDFSEWIWVPPGFAHGNYFREESAIEYFCSGEYSPKCEAGISPLARDIDWTLCEPALRDGFKQLVTAGKALISDKDRDGLTLSAWEQDERSNQFIYERPETVRKAG